MNLCESIKISYKFIHQKYICQAAILEIGTVQKIVGSALEIFILLMNLCLFKVHFYSFQLIIISACIENIHIGSEPSQSLS